MRNTRDLWVISIEFLSPHKCKGGCFFELKIPQILKFYNVKFAILENCTDRFNRTKYSEKDSKIARTDRKRGILF
jgi:hypothetical protein